MNPDNLKKMGKIIDSALQVLLVLLFICILGILPFYNRDGYATLGTDKFLFFKWSTMALIPLSLILATLKTLIDIKENRVRIKSTLSMLFAMGYACVITISWIFSPYKDTALWGESGWGVGLIPQLMCVGIYLLTAFFWDADKSFFRYIPLIAFPVSFVIFIIGIVNRFGFYFGRFIEYADVEHISTVGNINWFCAYCVTVMFAAIPFVKSKKTYRTPVIIYLAVGYIALILQGSLSGYLALIAIVIGILLVCPEDFFLHSTIFLAGALIIWFTLKEGIVYPNYSNGINDFLFRGILVPILFASSFALNFILWKKSSKIRNSMFKIPGRIIAGLIAFVGLAFIALIIINTLKGGEISKSLGMGEDNILTFSYTWASNRGATWITGWKIFCNQNIGGKLFGIGPDSMYAYLSLDAPMTITALVDQIFGRARLVNAHNEYLTLLINTGVFGVITFGGMMISAIVRFLKKGVKGNNIALAAAFALIAYTANNLFSFQCTMNLPFAFMALGLGEWSIVSNERLKSTKGSGA